MDSSKESPTIGNEAYTNGTAASGQTGDLSGYTKGETDAKLKDVNYTLLGVVVILLVMVATLLIDSFHINSSTYKEYSEKIDSLETTQKINEALLKQIQDLSEQNKQNTEIIKQLLKK